MATILAIIGMLANQSKSNQAADKQKQDAAGGTALPAEAGSGSLLNNFLSGAMNTPAQPAAQSATIGQGLSSADVGAMRSKGVTITDQPVGKTEQGITGAKVGTGGGGGGQYAQAVGSLLGSLASRPQQAPAGASVAPSGGADLASILQSLGIQAMAEGGFLQPGETAVVGEGGQPELVQATPQGGARVVPASAPASPPATQGEVASVTEPQGPGIAHQIGSTVLNDILAPIILGRLGLQGHFDAKRQAEAQQQNELAKGGAAHPELLESPNVARATDAVYGPGTSQRLRTANDPDQQAIAFGKRVGVKFMEPGTSLPNGTQAPGYAQQLLDATQNTGQVTINSKGLIGYKSPSVTLADQGRVAVMNTYQQMVDSGMPEREAATRAAAMGHRAGYVVPKEMLDTALGSVTNQLAAEKAGMEAEARTGVEVANKRKLSRLGALGTREGEQQLPQSPDEFLTNAIEGKIARLNASNEPSDVAERDELAKMSPAEQQLALRQGLDIQPANPTFMTRIAANEKILQRGEGVLSLFDPSQVGPVAGRSKDLKQFLGLMNVPEAQFRQSVRSLFNARRLALTGQQAAIKELERIEADVLSNKMSPSAFVAYLAGSMREAALDHAVDRGILKRNNQRAPSDYMPAEATIEFMRNPGLALKNQWRRQFKSAFNDEFESYIQGRGRQAAPPVPGAPQPVAGITPAPAAAPAPAPSGTPPANTMSPKQTAAARQVGGTLTNYANELTKDVNAGTLTPDQAKKMLQRAQDSGMPLE